MACLALKLRLAPCRETLGLPDTVLSAEDWKTVIASASDNTIDLASAYQWAGQLESSSMNGYGPWGIGVDGCARTPTDLMSYFNFGAGCSEVEVDLLSGEHTVIRTDIAYDCGTHRAPCLVKLVPPRCWLSQLCLFWSYMVTAVHTGAFLGTPMNPMLDIGQMEGAFVMGLGYYTRESQLWLPDGSNAVCSRAFRPVHLHFGVWPAGSCRRLVFMFFGHFR